MAILSRNKKRPAQDATKEIGVAGDVLFTGFDQEEQRTDKVSIKKYREMMDRDPTVESLFNIFTLPIVSATYRIDADENDKNEEQAEFIRRNLLEPPHKGGMETPFTLFQDQLLMAVVDGFALWEKVYKLENGRYVYKKLAYRDSIGITLIRDNEGGYGGARQIVSYGGKAVDVTFDPYKTFLFTHNKAREYLYGRSAFCSLRKPYEKKAKLEYLDSIALQADAIKPKILVRTQDGVVVDDDETGKSSVSNVRKRVLAALAKLGERNAVASIPYGYDVKEITQKGRDPHQSIERQNSEMARAFMATFSLMSSQGSNNTGSYALSDNLRDMLMISLKAFMAKAEEHINQYLIADLIDINFADPHYPEFHYDDITNDAVQVVADAFMKLIEKDRVSDEMVQGIEEQAANRLDINLEQIKKDRQARAVDEAKSANTVSKKPDGKGAELSDIGARDFPDLYKSLGVNEDDLGCIMLDLQPFDVVKHVPNGQDDLFSTDEAHSGGAVAESEAHVTLLYGLLQNGNIIKTQVDQVLNGWKCDSVVLDTIDSFPVRPDAPAVPIVAKMWNPDLQEANKRLSLLPHVNTFTEYNPHVTLAYVKNDPDIVQKWVKALNQVLAGMRVSSTGINYGDKPKSDKGDDANSGGKFLSDGMKWWRPLTPAEKTVKFADINNRMDSMESQFIDALTPIADRVKANVIEQVRSRKQSDTGDVSIVLPPEYTRTILSAIKTAYNYAKTGAADELRIAAPATSPEAQAGMQQLTDFVVGKQQNDLNNLIKTELLNSYKYSQLAEGDQINKEAPTSFIEDLSILLGKWFVSKIKATASAIVSKSINNGRDDVFATIANKDDLFQYSGILDTKICPICKDLDGSVVTRDEYLRTKWKAPIHFNCRCLWVLIRKIVAGEIDTDLPKVTGLPDTAGGVSGPSL